MAKGAVFRVVEHLVHQTADDAVAEGAFQPFFMLAHQAAEHPDGQQTGDTRQKMLPEQEP